MKSIAGAAVIGADLIFGAAAPEMYRNLHHEKGTPVLATYAIYAALLILTIWVIVSVAREVSGGGQGSKPAARPTSGYPFRGGL